MNNASLDPIAWYIWICDSSVLNCNVCKANDGKCFRGKDLPDYPPHDWCHCSIVEVPQEIAVAKSFENK